MERVYGYKVTDQWAVRPWLGPALYRAAVRTLLSSVLVSRDESVLFHGDPHAGNLLATDGGRLAILDWSLAGQLTTDDRVQVSQVLVGGWLRDAARIARAIGNLARGADEDLIRRGVEAALAELPWYKPAGPLWALGLLDSLGRAGVRFPARLLLFRKAFLTLQGVLSDLCPLCSLETVLVADGFAQLAWEWPLRWWKALDDRDYATHLSTADLLRMALRTA
jgi:ubiquinone biosynthesis protein